MQNNRDTIPNQWTKPGSPEYRREQDTKRRTKPASNAGLMDGGRPDGIRDNGRCDPTASRGKWEEEKDELTEMDTLDFALAIEDVGSA